MAERASLRGPFIGLMLLLGLTMAGAASARLWHVPEPQPGVPVAATRSLVFTDRDDGAVAVSAPDGTPVAVLPPGTNGFVRGALRGLARERRREDAAMSAPFHVTEYIDGRVTLQDPATGRWVDLRAFGATNAGAFARLLTAREENR